MHQAATLHSFSPMGKAPPDSQSFSLPLPSGVMAARRTPMIWLIWPTATETRDGTSAAEASAREYRNRAFVFFSRSRSSCSRTLNRDVRRPVDRATRKKNTHIRASSSRSILKVRTGGMNSRFHSRALSAAAISMAHRERMKNPSPTTPAR